MYIVVIQAKGALNCECQYVGPFASYMDAEDALCAMPVAKRCERKHIEKLAPFDRTKFTVYDEEAETTTTFYPL